MSPNQSKKNGTPHLIDTIETPSRHRSRRCGTSSTPWTCVTWAHGDDGPRRKIIDAAFKMTEQLVVLQLDSHRTS